MNEPADDFFRAEGNKTYSVPEIGTTFSTDNESWDSLPLEARKDEGEAMVKDHLERIDTVRKVFLDALDGFQNDNARIARESDSKVSIHLDSMNSAFVPVALSEKESLASLAQTLVRSTVMLEGEISIPNKIPEAVEALAQLRSDLLAIHVNLGNVSDSAKRLRDVLQSAVRNFDTFNAKNGEEYEKANVEFDRDSLNLASAVSSSIVRRAIILDIDVVTEIEKLPKAEKEDTSLAQAA